MRKFIAGTLIFFANAAFSSEHISLPSEGFSSTESIVKCESQVARLKVTKINSDKTSNAYLQVNPGSDSFIYFFTTAAEPAHHAMIRITMHPMADPLHPKESEMEFFGAYAGKEEDFVAWRKRVLYDFGRGFSAGVIDANKKLKESGEK